ncbi:MAG: mechanosensitive ion channel family protein, partial [Bacteroidota bacterium]
MFALLILGLLFRRVFNFVFEKILLRYAYRFGKENVAKNLIKPVARPLSLFVLYLILLGLVPVLSLPVSLNYFVLLFLKISIQIFAIVILMRVVDFISSYLTQMAEKTSGTLDDQLMPLLRKSLKIIILTVGILYILQSLKFDITTLLTGLSIGTLAFALAAQDTIKNLFGSITIFVDRPFQVGDWIVGDGIDGSIEEVGFRSTRVRTFHNSLIYIPNGRLADMTIDNMGLRKYRRFRTMLSLTYDTPPALINAFVDGVRQIIQSHPDTRKDYYHVYMNNFSAASLDVLFYAFFQVPDWTQELRCRHEVMLAILELADQLGVRFAFPTQTIHIEDFPGQKTLTPQYAKSELDKLALKEKVASFVEEYYDRPRRNSEYRGKDSGINEG